jgi:hypothetical protein
MKMMQLLMNFIPDHAANKCEAIQEISPRKITAKMPKIIAASHKLQVGLVILSQQRLQLISLHSSMAGQFISDEKDFPSSLKNSAVQQWSISRISVSNSQISFIACFLNLHDPIQQTSDWVNSGGVEMEIPFSMHSIRHSGQFTIFGFPPEVVGFFPKISPHEKAPANWTKIERAMMVMIVLDEAINLAFPRVVILWTFVFGGGDLAGGGLSGGGGTSGGGVAIGGVGIVGWSMGKSIICGIFCGGPNSLLVSNGQIRLTGRVIIVPLFVLIFTLRIAPGCPFNSTMTPISHIFFGIFISSIMTGSPNFGSTWDSSRLPLWCHLARLRMSRRYSFDHLSQKTS